MKTFQLETFRLTGIKLTPKQVSQFTAYENELLEWNERMNLTAIRDPEMIRIKHFLDSLTPLPELRDPLPTSLIDIGTGAGFPGIPLKIVLPSLKLTLVESIGKKADFCRHIVDMLGLENVRVVTARAEDIGQDPVYREKYDWAVARAVAAMPILAEYLLPLVRMGGAILAQKGESAPAEVQVSQNALKHLGGTLRKVAGVSLPGIVEERYLVVVEKKAATPPYYPRRAGVPSKKPL
jgi:16S rRNA (guanine527-N7)-methyltransferase